MLNFNNRATMSSVKNFQLINADTHEVVLQLGKLDDSTFSLDFQFPLCPFQAFGIALSSLATKFSCE
jgi:tubby-related protein 1